MAEQTYISASFIWNYDEVKAAKSSRPFLIAPPAIITAVLVMALVMPILIPVLNGEIPVYLSFKDVALILGAVTVIYLIFRAEQNRSFKKAVTQNPIYNKRITYKFSRDEIISEVEGAFENKRPWHTLARVHRAKKGFFFFETPQIYVWIPDHAFRSKEDLDTVAEFARQAVKKFTRSPRAHPTGN